MGILKAKKKFGISDNIFYTKIINEKITLGEFFMFNIKEIRIIANKNQEETANLLKVSRSSFAMWESGNEIIPIKRLIEFCNIFHVSLDYCLGLTDKNTIYPTFYNREKSLLRLKEFRKEKKLTQEKLANILNTNKSVICGYEKGRYMIATPFLYQICKKYHISADYLLGRSEQKEI